ncbi:MAG: adenylyltransferase/cytidyltransferase family protein [Moorellaceae bacterium]
MKKIGLTIGKFAPLHKGHQLVIETALREMDELYVVIYHTHLINIPLQRRASWIQTLYPTVKIIFANEPPNQYGLDDKAVKVQMDYLSSLIGSLKVTHFYSSEKYGRCAAQALQAEDRQVDPARTVVPICASAIREDPSRYKRYMEPLVYEDVVRYCREMDKHQDSVALPVGETPVRLMLQGGSRR